VLASIPSASAQLRERVLHRRPPLRRILCQHSEDRRLELGRTFRMRRTDRRHRTLGVRLHDSEGRALERDATGDKLVGENAE
jgi:hypothetical protein